jgi:hypothetical protein
MRQAHVCPDFRLSHIGRVADIYLAQLEGWNYSIPPKADLRHSMRHIKTMSAKSTVILSEA